MKRAWGSTPSQLFQKTPPPPDISEGAHHNRHFCIYQFSHSPGKLYIHTCLLANTNSTASLSSSSLSILANSSYASPALSLSLLSTTNIRPKNKQKMSSAYAIIGHTLPLQTHVYQNLHIKTYIKSNTINITIQEILL